MTVFSSTGRLREDLVIAELHNVCSRSYSRLGHANNIITLTECLRRGWITKVPRFGTYVYQPTQKGLLAVKIATPLIRKD